MLPPNDRSSLHFRQFAILLLVLLGAHFPLFFNHDLVMDDWLLLKPQSSYVVDMNFMLQGAGHPVFFSYFSLANWTGAPISAMQTLAFVSIASGALCAASVASRLKMLTPLEALAAALIIWTYPAYGMWAGKANTVYVFSFSLFFIGSWLLSLCFGAGGKSRIFLRICAAMVFFFSFALNSTMVLYAFSMLALYIATYLTADATTGMARRALTSAFRTVMSFPELAVLPLIYWAVLNIWFARVGVYATYYNTHLPTFADIADGIHTFVTFGYTRALRDAVRTALENRSMPLAAALLVLTGLFLSRAKCGPRMISAVAVGWPIVVAIAVFLAISVPYLIVGARPGEHVYETRHLLLFGIPLALALLSLKRFSELLIPEPFATAAVFGGALILAIPSLWAGYAFLQARALKQESLVEHLASLPKPAALVFGVVDGFEGKFGRNLAFGITELSGMLRLAWGDEPFFGFTEQAERTWVLREMECARTAKGTAFSHIAPTGPQATISMQPGPSAGPAINVARHYYACRLFGSCDVSQFVQQQVLVDVKAGPIPNIDAVNDLHCDVFLRGERAKP